MASTSTKMFLVTANIASCFDNPKEMLNTWLDEFFKVIRERDPQFIALHCQEVGGKNYETSMENVEEFLRNLLNRASFLRFTRNKIFIDEDFTSAEKFTALGNLYFIRNDVEEAKIWDFKEKVFVDVEGKEEFVGNIEEVSIKEKSKFPQEFFPECKWSRKGFMRTRWCLNGTSFDLVNIHLFHDASNFIAMEQFPSVYTMNRKRAMEHTLDRFHNDEFDNIPIFLFGDFNFRLDTGSVVEKLTEDCKVPEELEVLGEKTREFKDKKEETSVLLVSKKSFSHAHHSSIFAKDNGSWLRDFDKELSGFAPRLVEFPITFAPSYPFEEGPECKQEGGGGMYMKTRCPSWCDRVILTQNAKGLVQEGSSEVHYDVIGPKTRMGDHKPVGLSFAVPTEAGRVPCCSDSLPCSNFVHVPDNTCFLVGKWCRCKAYPICPCATLNPTHPNSSPPSYFPSKTPENGTPPEMRHPSAATDLLLKNLMRLGTSPDEFSCRGAQSRVDGGDFLLKRVHSDPVKVRAYQELLRGANAPLHSHLVHAHSLDGQRKGKSQAPSRLRLRNFSSRMSSHHSSSSEDWFEEVPPSPGQERGKEVTPGVSPQNERREEAESRVSSPSPNPSASSRGFQPRYSFGSDDGDSVLARDGIIVCERQKVQQENSLNNLLLPSETCSSRSANPSSSDFPPDPNDPNDPCSDTVVNPVVVNSGCSGKCSKGKRVRSVSDSGNNHDPASSACNAVVCSGDSLHSSTGSSSRVKVNNATRSQKMRARATACCVIS